MQIFFTFAILYMKKNLTIVFIFLVCFTAAIIPACKKENMWDCFKGTGDAATETRILSPFTKVYVKDNVNVILTQGPQNVKIEAGNNLIALIKTEVKDGILTINNDNKCNWARSYTDINVYVTLPTLRFLWHYGTGLVKSNDTIACDTLEIWAHQTGDINLTVKANTLFPNMHTTSDLTLHGKCAIMGIYHSGEGFLHAEDLQTDYAWTYSSASGDEYLNAKVELDANITWVGNVYYHGNPAATRIGDGTGNLIHQN